MQNMVALFAAFLALIGLIVSIWINNKQLSVQSFISYVNKYDSLAIHDFPEWKMKESQKYIPDEDNEHLSRALDAYLHLCCQEYFLYKKKMISKSIWKIWKPEIEQNLGTTLVLTYWVNHRSRYFALNYPQFHDYVSKIQQCNNTE